MYEAILSATDAHSSILTLGDGGTWSYGGTADPLNMLPPFDKGIKLAMGQANVKRWSDDPMPLVTDAGAAAPAASRTRLRAIDGQAPAS